ncbi:hypothetical protein NHQ30_009482 [Ciborinia camelliae]|nr:hypothetical protein NHQ30_009482 [Ciborinia camelliae]
MRKTFLVIACSTDFFGQPGRKASISLNVDSLAAHVDLNSAVVFIVRDASLRCIARLNYILSIDMLPIEGDDRRSSRILSCPAIATFEEFHCALNIAFSSIGSSNFNRDCKFTFYEWETLSISGPLMNPLRMLYEDRRLPTGTVASSLIRNLKLFEVLDNYPPNRNKKVEIIYENGGSLRDCVILLLEREAPTSQFVALWSGATRCMRGLAGNQCTKILWLAYEASEPTVEEKELISFCELPDVSDNRDCKAINKALSQLWTSICGTIPSSSTLV